MPIASRAAVLMLSLLLVWASGVSAASTTFDQALANHFSVDDSVMAHLAAVEINSEDMTVALFLADVSGSSVEHIVHYRTQGDDWAAIMKTRQISPTDLYFMISGKIESKRFAPIFAKFDSIPHTEWDKLVLEDEEIIDIINLRFVFGYYDYSVFKVMNLRESGYSWVVVHNSVRDTRNKMLKEEKAKAKAARDAEADGN